MDFLDRLNDSINSIPNLPVKIKKGYLSEKESLAIYSLPGGRVTQRFYDGSKEETLNYEIGMKSEDGVKVETTLREISDFIENLAELKSRNGSFSFMNISIASKPFIGPTETQDWFVFLLEIQAKIITY
ncbi:minor capsid protein [Enterococcus hulanensis]|uniref:minor capsid protein n=1 Tax=Enterococcus hulanensis TaxID=2559929 RepID=UPI001A901FBC|nr:minor capsid protein [Enterococcus hulanensis]MBO0456189.1 minor capsid protein [Enterococcus hulanensis]